MLLISTYNQSLKLKNSYWNKGAALMRILHARRLEKRIQFHLTPVLCWWDVFFWQVSALRFHFFFAASRFGADTLTFPGTFLDRSASWNKGSQMKETGATNTHQTDALKMWRFQIVNFDNIMRRESLKLKVRMQIVFMINSNCSSFIDKTTSREFFTLTLRNRSFSLGEASLAFMKLNTAVRAA